MNLLVMFIFSSCQTTGSSQNIHNDQALGFIKWESIPAAESKISIIDENELIKERREKQVSQRNLLSQAFRLPKGSFLYEKRDEISGDIEVLSPREEILKRYAGHKEFLAKGLSIKEEDIVKSSGVEGDFAHVLVESPEKRCVVFFGYSSKSSSSNNSGPPDLHYEALTGSVCEQQGTASAATVERDVLDLLSRVRFDDGAYTRKQLLAQAFKKLDALEEDRQRETERDKVAPQITVADSVDAERQEILVTGKVWDDSEIDMVKIDKTWIKLNPDGSFSSKVTIDPGQQILNMVAIDRFGNRAEKNINVSWVKAVEEAVPVKEDYGTYYALLIGNNKYQHWRDLDTPHYDVQALGDILQERYGFKQREVLLDASQEEIIKRLKELQDKLQGNENLLIYFSGHGVLHKGKGYWVPTDGFLDDPEKWISNDEINRALRRTPALHVIVVADSCYSGTFCQQKIELGAGLNMFKRSRTAMSAGSGEEVVLEPVLAEGEKDNSVFAKKLIKVLQLNTDTVRYGYDIFNEVKEQLKMYPQHPQYGALPGIGHEEGGDFFFVKNNNISKNN